MVFLMEYGRPAGLSHLLKGTMFDVSLSHSPLAAISSTLEWGSQGASLFSGIWQMVGAVRESAESYW